MAQALVAAVVALSGHLALLAPSQLMQVTPASFFASAHRVYKL
jgi:hypothetical protein